MKSLRIVMWSGPRNLSTAMMRSFSSRADTNVVDEPFYAAYLAATGLNHPMRHKILSAGETDWRKVAEACGADPVDPPIRYEKHMTHHMIDGFGLDWMKGAAIAFLIRDPAAVAASYAVKRAEISAADLGNERQAEIFDYATRLTGSPPPVVDAHDIRSAPEAVLTKLCAVLGIPFAPAMLSWRAGPHPADGVWAPHWYNAIYASTGFAPPDSQSPKLTAELEEIVAQARPHYERLAAYRLRP